jgi:hypothetical protein
MESYMKERISSYEEKYKKKVKELTAMTEQYIQAQTKNLELLEELEEKERREMLR